MVEQWDNEHTCKIRLSGLELLQKDVLDAIAKQYKKLGMVLLPRLFADDVLRIVETTLDERAFQLNVFKSNGYYGEELILPRENNLTALLTFVMNRREVIETFKLITGIERIQSFVGRVTRLLPQNRRHKYLWHNDCVDGRLAAVSINLSKEVYSGGRTQLRASCSRKLISDIANVGYGDGLLLRLTPSLEHRVTNTEGVLPRTTFAGFFTSEPSVSVKLMGMR